MRTESKMNPANNADELPSRIMAVGERFRTVKSGKERSRPFGIAFVTFRYLSL